MRIYLLFLSSSYTFLYAALTIRTFFRIFSCFTGAGLQRKQKTKNKTSRANKNSGYVFRLHTKKRQRKKIFLNLHQAQSVNYHLPDYRRTSARDKRRKGAPARAYARVGRQKFSAPLAIRGLRAACHYGL